MQKLRRTASSRRTVLQKMRNGRACRAGRRAEAVLSEEGDRCRQEVVRPADLSQQTRAAVALLVLILILILSIASCRPKKLRSADEVADAVIAALETGDGKALAKLASLSEPLTGQHPEIFGEGDTPHEVMQNYYRTLADERYAQWKAAYGKGFTLVPQLETAVYSGTDVFEINRALDIDAERYAVLSGTLSVGDAFAANISMTVVEWQGEWRLLVLYLD